jgi:hypothetical protein
VVAQFLDGFHVGRIKQFRIFLANPGNPYQVSHVGPLQQPAHSRTGSFGGDLPVPGIAAQPGQFSGRADSRDARFYAR